MKRAPVLKPDLLLAKSFEPGKWKGSYSLVGHTADVVNAVSTLIDVLGDRLIEQFGLQCSLSYLRATARLAAYIHDWGKANHHFQLMVRGNAKYKPNLLRHEIVSVLLAWEYRHWLQECAGDFMIALVAAGGHHVKFGGKAGKPTDNVGEISELCGRHQIYLYTHPDYFRDLIRYGFENLDLPRKVELFPGELPLCWKNNDIESKQKEILKAFRQWQSDPVFTAVLKALVIAGDTIGSALPKQGVKIQSWIEQQLKNTLTTNDIEKIIIARLKNNQPRQFQLKLSKSDKRVTLARAGCGTGKTVGAYMWMKQHAEGRRLFFGYPTTGTSTEGFLDYVHDKVDSELLHSRAAVDLEHIAQTKDNDDLATKLESFKAWGSKVTVCTVDTILGLVQCNRRSLYCFPAIAQSAFVFDEIHCYDDRLFGGLLRFLEVVKAPVLLMSASVLPSQLKELEKAVGKEELEIIPGEKKLEIKPRYKFQLVDTPDWEKVEQELNGNGKVLWVCNQVKTAIAIYQEAKKRGLNPLIYHSRYRYEDRVKHHRQVIDIFNKPLLAFLYRWFIAISKNKLPAELEVWTNCTIFHAVVGLPVLAITTQVAEMSLDLSATLLISQIANPASLIQRLGRLNRRYCGYALEAMFYPDPKVRFPYSQKELDKGLSILQELKGDVSQADLANWLEKNDAEADFKPDKETVLFNPRKKWQSYPSNCRQAGHTITVLLEIDFLPLRKIYFNSKNKLLLNLLLASSDLFLTYTLFSSVENCPAKLRPRYTVPLVFTKDFKTKNPKTWEYYPIAETKNYGYSSELGAYEL